MKMKLRPRRPLRERMSTMRLLDTLSGLPEDIKAQVGELEFMYRSMSRRALAKIQSQNKPA